MELRGRTAVVTGGASGIGRALIQRFAREGANVVVADLDDAGMAAVAGEAQALGVKALAVRTDVADLAQVQALAARAFEAFGAVHVLCNNAGVAMWGGLESATHRDWQWVLGVNLWGVSETLAKDLKPYRIAVSVLCPLGVQTQIRQSERNRPAALRNERDERAAPVELIGRSLAPETVADMVLAAIHANELYVITHDESLEPLRRRFERIERSILDHRR
ncbi:MAG: hypothetical protein DME02_19105 [Candidatus Rokuibacteriota bacterium]|nr:MAG: hypothetical protein DME02_19105 [Candidatus Rokubacteria bacterium]